MVEQILLMIAPHDRLSLDDGAMRLLCAHDWPGNLFELRALIHRAVGLHPGQRIGEASVKMMLAMGRPHRMSLPGAEPCEGQIKLQPGFNIKAFLDEEERHFLHSALLKTDGNVQAAADLTGVTLSTFVKRMQKHGLTVSQYRNNDNPP
jgi:sigma-54 specific flagellar transcriptional regulator A